MRVALVGPSFPPQFGGVEEVMSNLATCLAGLGCPVEVLVQRRRQDAPVPAVQELPSGVVVRWFESRTRSYRFPVAPSLARFLSRHARRYDVIHGHGFHGVPASMAALLTDRPFVYSPHYHGEGHTPVARLAHVPYRPIARRAFGRASAVIAVSQVEAERLQAAFGLPTGRLHVVPNGIRSEEILAATPMPSDGTVVLTAARLEHYKQVDVLVRSVAHLDPAFRLVVLGDGPARPHLERLVDGLGLTPRVTFTGRVTNQDLRRWQRRADVVATLSRHEAYGMLLLEGLVAGAPVVASDIPAHREVAAAFGDAVRFVAVDADPAAVAAAVTGAARGRAARPHGGGGPNGGLGPAGAVPTWEAAARRCLALYSAAAGGQPVGTERRRSA